MPSCGQRVQRAGDGARKHHAPDRLVALEVTQPLGERLLADAAHALEQLAVPQRLGLEVVQDERRPVAADEVSGSLGRMVLRTHVDSVEGHLSVPPWSAVLVGSSVVDMHANDPGELPLVFRHYFNASDVDGLLSRYYADGATYAPLPGVALSQDVLRAAIGRLVDLGHPIELTVRHVLAAQDTALIVLDWEIAGAGMSGTATDVARRQANGTWRCIVDNPHGGAHSVDLPERTAAALAG